MRKRVSSIFMVLVLAVCCISTNAFARETDSNNEEDESKQIILEKDISKVVTQKGVFEEEKIQNFDSLTEGAETVREVIENNSDLFQEKEEGELFVDNCVIVKTDEDIAFDTSAVITAVRYDGIYYVQYETVEDAKNAIDVFQKYPTVEYAVADGLVVLDDKRVAVGDTSYSQDANGYQHLSWGVNDMKVDVFADYVANNTNKSVSVGVIDSGVYASHPFLKGRILSNGYDFVDRDSNPNDVMGHGTHVSGTIVDCTPGVKVNILPVKVFGADGQAAYSTIADGVRYAVNAGVDVINLSLCGLESNESQVHLDNAINQALAKDIVVVASSGNEFDNTVNYCPAHRNDIIITGAIDSQHNIYYDNVSGKGSNYGYSVDVVAPGVSVKSCVPYSISSSGYAHYTGTSMAAPHISATAAMLKLLYPTASYTQIETIIKSCAQDIGTSGYDTNFGMGLPILSGLITNMPFYDVQKSDWYYSGVFGVYTRGYMTGKRAGYFGAIENMQRQDVAVLIYRMAGSPAVTYRYLYPDVSKDDYFANAAIWAYDNGILTGNNGKMGVGTDIYRQDFALILYRYAKSLGLNVSNKADISKYSDAASVSAYAKDAMAWAVGNGIIGQTGNYLNPLGNANRAEIAVMINRFVQKYKL